MYLALFEEALRDAALRKLFLDSYNEIMDDTVAALVGASRANRPDGEPLSADEADGIAYLLLCAAVGNAHLSRPASAPPGPACLGAFCRRTLTLLTS